MNIGLVDVDGHNFPNFALMKLSAWHKAHGDNVEWASPLFGNYDRVYQSKIFTFSPDTCVPWNCEIAATNLFTSVRLFPYMWNGMMQGKSISEGRVMQGNKRLNEKRIHPTQKPVALYAWLLMNFAKDKWKILDTHLGSGSIAIACERLGFSLLGIEKDAHYYDAARKRIIKYQQQPRLF